VQIPSIYVLILYCSIHSDGEITYVPSHFLFIRKENKLAWNVAKCDHLFTANHLNTGIP